jgi:acyl transferase domain-containing protein/NADPH:quinone reductase-like Zn-dependent oxidoreductase
MDPCQRGLMENTYLAIENAGIPLQDLSGTNTSVHVGCFSNDHMISLLRDIQQIPKYAATATAQSILANRVSWFFNLLGPSTTIDTACSSGLTALDLACQGLWANRSDAAIVAGASLILSPEFNVSLSNMNFLSPDGRCYSFDHRANGYARGEGFATLVLKPLHRALKDGNNIRALIRAIGSNQDGYTPSGITQPSYRSQVQLIRETYYRAGLDMNTTRFFEAHGTGTAIGDPTEARAIGESYNRSKDNPLYVGALKSNIGHLEGTSGLAGVVKVILALERGIMPPNANFQALNPDIDGEFFHLEFAQASVRWEDSIRRASVNSFGFGGSNVHCILDDASSFLRGKHQLSSYDTQLQRQDQSPLMNGYSRDHESPQEQKHESEDEPSFFPQLLVLSASDQSGIKRQIQTHNLYIQTAQMQSQQSSLVDYAYTLAVHRTHLAWRAFCVIDDPDKLANLSAIVSTPIPSRKIPLSIGFVFTGQGSQWFGMGRDLLHQPVFRESINRSQACLATLAEDYHLIERLTNHEYAESMNAAQNSQILTTCLQLALVDLLKWLHVKPHVVVGHSSGEIAAAYASGYLSHHSAVKVSYYRGQLCSKLEQKSNMQGMAAIGLSHDKVMDEIIEAEAAVGSILRINVSCINSPRNVTIAGPLEALELLVARLHAKNIFARTLKVRLAYHTSQMESIAAEYSAALGTLSAGSHAPALMVSSVTGQLVDQKSVCTGQYWVQNLLSRVDFLSAVRMCHFTSASEPITPLLDRSHLSQIRVSTWLEIGPHSTLRGPLREILACLKEEGEVGYVSACIRNKSAISTILAAMGELHCEDTSAVDITRLTTLGLSDEQIRARTMLTNTPQYSFNHETVHWEESSLNKARRFRSCGEHDLLGMRIDDGDTFESQWKFYIHETRLPWITDHQVNGDILYPAAGMLVMVIEAAKQLMQPEVGTLIGLEITDASFPSPIRIQSPKESVEVRTYMSARHDRGIHIEYDFRVLLCKLGGAQELVCSGRVRGDYKAVVSNVDGGREAREKRSRNQERRRVAIADCNEQWKAADMYQTLREGTGIDYGPTFQVLDNVYYGNGNARAVLVPYISSTDCSPYTVHPSRIDGVFQLGFAAIRSLPSLSVGAKTFVPTRLSRLWLSLDGLGHPGKRHEQVLASIVDSGARFASIDFSVSGEADTPLCVVDRLELTAITRTSAMIPTARYMCSQIQWKVDLGMLDDQEIFQYCELARRQMASPVAWLTAMHRLILHFTLEALRALEDQTDRIAPSMVRYHEWLCDQKAINSGVALSGTLEFARLCEAVRPSARAEMAIVVGRHLQDVLLGRVDPLELIFNDENKVAALYQEMNETATGYDPLCRYLDDLVHKTPSLKFLEIGAGTGSTTSIILNVVGNRKSEPRFSEYAFTDLSPFFLEKAKEMFSGFPNMTYRTLNIESDITSQGFGAEEYDVIIADNILHATKDLQVTLANVRRLLRPGGKLILKEVVSSQHIIVGFVFGLLPGWWLAHEKERSTSPCINEKRWDAFLKDSNFSGTDLTFRDHVDETCHQWSILISTAVESHQVLAAPHTITAEEPIFILDKTSDKGMCLAHESNKLICGTRQPQLMTLREAAAHAIEPKPYNFIFLNDCERPVLEDLDEETLTQLQVLFARACYFLWVTQGENDNGVNLPHFAISDGLLRVVRAEGTRATLVRLALDVSSSSAGQSIAKVYSHTKTKTRLGGFDEEYVDIRGDVCIPRLVRADDLDAHVFKRTKSPVIPGEVADNTLKMEIRVPSLIDTIEFSHDTTSERPLEPDEVIIRVEAIGVNFKDCMSILGRINFDPENFGSECSGVVHKIGNAVTDLAIGDRVAACTVKAYRTHARASQQHVIKMPDSMTFVEGSSIPTVYCTALYSLSIKAGLKKGETVLIHAAAGATGQAALQLAQYIGADIIVTVGSGAKKRHLMDNYQISEDRILYSRDDTFADGVQRLTSGRGVDVVLNSVSGPLLEASWKCIAPLGRFVEIGFKDVLARKALPMEVFARGASFLAVDMAIAYEHDQGLYHRLMSDILALFTQGRLRTPHPINVYPLDQAAQAFRHIQSGKGPGKVVLQVGKSAVVPVRFEILLLNAADWTRLYKDLNQATNLPQTQRMLLLAASGELV